MVKSVILGMLKERVRQKMTRPFGTDLIGVLKNLAILII